MATVTPAIATPGPWTVRVGNRGRLAITGRHHIPEGMPAVVGGFLHVCDLSGDKRHDEANADLIVRAVNCHADLLAVCRELVAAVVEPDRMSGALIDRAEKIIRQAAPRGDAGRRVTG